MINTQTVYSHRTTYPTLLGPEQNYNPENIVENLQKMRKSGVKICVFLCRTEEQSLPSINGEFWVSADREVKGIIPDSRIHLWIDLTDNIQLEKFHGLFDKLAIDQSSVKFLGNEFCSRFVKLFFPSENTEFVFENTFNTVFSKAIENPQINFNSIYLPEDIVSRNAAIKTKWVTETYPKDSPQYNEEFGIFKEKIKVIATRQNWTEEDFLKKCQSWIVQTKFPKELDLSKAAQLEATRNRESHLKKYFQDVTLHENELYPYETRVRSNEDCFFICKNAIFDNRSIKID